MEARQILLEKEEQSLALGTISCRVYGIVIDILNFHKINNTIHV